MVEQSQWLTFLVKVGVVIGFGFLAYLLLKRMVGFLASLVVWSNKDPQELSGDPTITKESSDDPIDYVPGLHVLSEFGAEHRFVDKNPTEEIIRATIRGLDWIDGFHQVLLVTSPGISLEVGGSLDPEDGLASVYRDEKNEIFRVTREPPTTVENMVDLLVSFHLGDGDPGNRISTSAATGDGCLERPAHRNPYQIKISAPV